MGFPDKRLGFGGGGGPGTPWGALGALVAKVLAPHGYETRIERYIRANQAPTMVAAGQLELGATNDTLTRWAYQGAHEFRGRGPAPRLRVIASIMMPMWIGVATRWELGITDLDQIRERRMPVRILGGRGAILEPILARYGLSPEFVASCGGRFLAPHTHAPGHDFVMAPWVSTGEVDLIIDNIAASYAIEGSYWWEASVLMNLRYHPLPDDVIATICRDYGGEPGFIPFRLLRGVNAPVASVSRTSQLIFGRDDMPDAFAYTLAKGLDTNRHLFRETHMAHSYDSKQVWHGQGVPLHPGAERYYRDAGYLG